MKKPRGNRVKSYRKIVGENQDLFLTHVAQATLVSFQQLFPSILDFLEWIEHGTRIRIRTTGTLLCLSGKKKMVKGPFKHYVSMFVAFFHPTHPPCKQT